jgi:hypothetical protein
MSIVPRSRAGAREAIYRPQTEKHRDVGYIRAKMRRFKDSGCGIVPRIKVQATAAISERQT